MADYHAQCVVTPCLPTADIAPAERLLLDAIFDHEVEDDHVYYFAEICRQMSFALPVEQVRSAMVASPKDCVATRFFADLIAGKGESEEDDLDIDMDDHWMEILQDIVRRSSTLTHIAIETGYTTRRLWSPGDRDNGQRYGQHVDEPFFRRSAGQ